jgi:hypothetical protein
MADAAELAKILASVASIKGGAAAVLRAAKREATALRAARGSYKRHHWGLTGPRGARELRCADPSGPVTEMGLLYAVEYLSEKGDDGESMYRHELEAPYPVLAFDRAGLLLIAGGGYKVEERGIVG